MSRSETAARRRTTWAESMPRTIRCDVERLTARGLDVGSIAVRLGIRTSKVLEVQKTNSQKHLTRAIDAGTT